MADDIARSICVRCNESEISGRFGPSNGCWRVGLVRVLVDEISSVLHRIGDNPRDETMGGNGSSRGKDAHCGGLHHGRHF